MGECLFGLPGGEEMGRRRRATPSRGAGGPKGVHVFVRVKKMAVALAVGSLGMAGAVSVAVTPAAPAGAASSASTVTIADLCSCTGPEASSISQTSDTMQAWASWVNSHGGLAGHQVHLVVLDDGYSAAKALANAETAINQDHAVAIFDNSDEDPSFASVVAVGPRAGAGRPGDGLGVARTPTSSPPAPRSTTPTRSVPSSPRTPASRRWPRSTASRWPSARSRSTRGRQVASHYGIKYVYTSGIGFAAPNYTAAVPGGQAVRRHGHDGRRRLVGRRARRPDCAAQGYTPRQLSSDGTVAIAWLKIPAFNGNIDTQSDILWFVHNSATSTMYAALDKYAPASPSGPNFGEVVLQSWSDGALLQAAVPGRRRPAGTPVTSAVILKGLYALPTVRRSGVSSPPLHFVKGQPANNSCFFVMGIKNGKFVVQHNGTPICAPLVKAGTLPS